MDWIQTLSIIVTVIGSSYYIHRDIHEDMKAVNTRIDDANVRIDAVNIRADQLYTILIDLLKEGRK